MYCYYLCLQMAETVRAIGWIQAHPILLTTHTIAFYMHFSTFCDCAEAYDLMPYHTAQIIYI